MGCSQSKIENQESVNRCKERKAFMKESVFTRNAFAAAHFAYAVSVKNTGAALSDYAEGEVRLPDSSSAVVRPLPYDLRPPPPPPPDFSPLQRAATMPELRPEPELSSRPDPVVEEGNGYDEIEVRSSGGGGGRIGISKDENLPPPPSPPPSPSDPPPRQNENETNLNRTTPAAPLSDGMSPWSFFFPALEDVPGPNLAEVDDESSRIEREEIRRKVLEEERKMGGGGGGYTVEDVPAEVVEPPQLPPKAVKKVRVAAAEGRRSSGKVNLLQTITELDDCFLKASECAHEVLKMLEAYQLHYHSNFADNRGHIDLSARVMRVITWNKSFKGLQNAEDGTNDFDSEENETHATVLDKLLAREKKLYDEVKAGEQMKHEYQKKIAALHKLKKRGACSYSVERTRASVNRLHTRYIVNMQSMDSTVSEINRLRDEQLYPKLVQLVEGMAVMWENMRIQHDKQSKIVQALRLLDITQSPKETSKHHFNNTHQLLVHVQMWHSDFQKLIQQQKDYVKSVNNWLKVNLIPIDTNLRENVSSPQRPQNPPIQSLLRTWHDCLEKLPEEGAKTAFHNFTAVMDIIVQYQVDEMKMKERCEETQRELQRKARKFEDWYNKQMQKRTPPDETNPDLKDDKDVIAEQQIVMETLKKRLEEEEEAYQRLCVQVRDQSLMNLKTGLLEVFRAMSEFSRACAHMYRSLKFVTTFVYRFSLL